MRGRQEIKELDLEVRGGGNEEREGVGGRSEVEFGAEDRMGNLDIAYGSLEK